MESETQKQLQTIGNYVAREESLEKNQLEKGKTDLSRNLGILLPPVEAGTAGYL